MTIQIVNPSDLAQPRGFSHGVVTPPGARILYVAGQTAVDGHHETAEWEFTRQFEAALVRVLRVVTAAGGAASHIARMTIYVTDMEAYRASRPALSDIWKRHMGLHFPAIALVQVTGLVDRGATVEIQADAVLP